MSTTTHTTGEDRTATVSRRRALTITSVLDRY